MSIPKPVKEDPVKLHKDASALMENGKYADARDLFTKTADLYYKGQNYFGSAEMYYKAGECSFALKDYEKGVELFMKSAEISLDKKFERFGLSALDYARDCQKALGHTKEVEELTKRIKELKDKLEPPASNEEQSFSVFS
ncbi:MAG TPA: tetratricopeptide repeat protein [Candidatus Nanoarchaeia archaeon]|nr:tetratricopeptide repeat protein [Candidatus Nanoarchaeia archaeon]